jgi:hypothetical protein
MIWALAFTILLKLLGGSSPFIVPKLDNYVKKYVVDDSRKKEVTDMLKVAKKERKTTLKKDKKLLKELYNISESRTSTQADFDRLYEDILNSDTRSQNANIKVNQESQKLITSDEWASIMTDVAKNLEKTDKKRTKSLNKVEKKFNKWQSKINKTIIDTEKRKKAVEAVEELKIIYLKNYRLIQKKMMNKNSVMYKYNASDTEIMDLQNNFLQLVKEVYDINTRTHFKLVELSTPEEWKKIK